MWILFPLNPRANVSLKLVLPLQYAALKVRLHNVTIAVMCGHSGYMMQLQNNG